MAITFQGLGAQVCPWNKKTLEGMRNNLSECWACMTGGCRTSLFLDLFPFWVKLIVLMARSSKPPLDPDGNGSRNQRPSSLTPSATVFILVRTDPQYVICKVCPSRGMDKKPAFCRCHVAGHIQSKRHQKNLWGWKEQDIPLKLGTLKRAFSLLVETPTLDTFVLAPDGLLSPPPFDSNIGDPEVPLGQAWDEFKAERTVHVDDYFDEIQQMIKNGESIFPTMLPPLLEDELGLEDFDELDLIPPNSEDHGIDVEGSYLFSDFPSFLSIGG